MEKPKYVIENNNLFRKNTDGTKTLFPFITGNTYNKYKTSKDFMKTLELAFSRYGDRVKNERKQLISLSGKTKPVHVKNEGTFNFPIEVFNKIIEASNNVGINPKQGLAIAIKESSGYTHPDRVNTYYKGKDVDNHWFPEYTLDQAGPSTIVSNWQYFEDSPYISLLKGWENSGWDVDKVQKDAEYQYKKHQKDYDKWDSNINEDILENMFKIPLNKINSKSKNYVPTIQKYINGMSYKFGGSIRKFGDNK